jgi:hypothetical protein
VTRPSGSMMKVVRSLPKRCARTSTSDPTPGGLRDPVVLVGEQREAELVVVVKALDLRRGIGRDPECRGPRRGVLGAAVARAARLGRAPRGFGLRVEVHDHPLAAEVRELNPEPVLVGELASREGQGRRWDVACHPLPRAPGQGRSDRQGQARGT